MDYFSDSARDYAKKSQSGIWGYWRRKESRAVMALLQVGLQTHVFEVGAGAGFYLQKIKDLGLVPAAGCDRSMAMVAECVRKGLNVSQGEYQQFQLTPPAHRILAAGVLEFISQLSPFLVWAKKNTQHGAILVMLVPYDNWVGKLYRFFHKQHGVEVFLRSEKELKLIAKTAGWDFMEKRPGSMLSYAMCFRRKL